MLFSTKELYRKSKNEALEIIKREEGVVYKDVVPSWAVEGTIIKRELVKYEGLN